MGVEGLEGSDGEFVVCAVGWEVGGCVGLGSGGRGVRREGEGVGRGVGVVHPCGKPNTQKYAVKYAGITDLETMCLTARD